jgi:hypothetical protein
MSRAAKISKYVQLISLAALAIVLLFWPFFEALAPSLNLKQIASIMMAVLAGAYLYFDDRLSDIIRGPRDTVSNGKMSECVDRALRSHRHVKHLRVYALSSETIQPIIEDSEIHIDKCTLLLRAYPEEGRPGAASYNRRIEERIREWEQMKAKGFIKELEVSRFEAEPTVYVVIFDDRAMMIGNYYICDHVPSGTEYLQPTLILGLSVEGQQMIRKSVNAFDLNFDSCCKREQARKSAEK